jgi:hypothetical protein
VFGQCKIVDQSLLGRSKGAFMQQYFVENRRPDFSEWTPRPGALDLVMKKIKPATFVLEPGEYKDKLPPCHAVELRVDMDDRKPYEDMKKDFVAELPDAKAIAVNAAVVTQKLQQIASGFVYTPEPHWLGFHKFNALDELLDENQHANTIIVYHYQEELAELKRRYGHLVTLDHDNAIGRWNAGEVRLLAVHPKSAGHGLNLQGGGNIIVWYGVPYNLEWYQQANARLYRQGQKEPSVIIHHLIAANTEEEKVVEALTRKDTNQRIVLDSVKL